MERWQTALLGFGLASAALGFLLFNHFESRRARFYRGEWRLAFSAALFKLAHYPRRDSLGSRFRLW
jgi:hypothetical protein